MIFTAFATGIAAALAGRNELKVSPRHALLTRSFAAYVIFAFLVMVPTSAYFYVFHGDWFLLYLLDVQRIPSAIALVFFVALGGLGIAGYAIGAGLVRSQREMLSGALVGLCVLVGLGSVLLAWDRLARVGSYAQWHGGFGLETFEDGPLLPGTVAMALLLSVGLAFLLIRVWAGSRQKG